MVLVGTATIAGCKIMIEGALAVGDFFYGLAAGLGVPHDEVEGDITYESEAETLETGSYSSSSSSGGGVSAAPPTGSVTMRSYLRLPIYGYMQAFYNYFPLFAPIIKATVAIDSESTNSTRPWDKLEWNCPDLNKGEPEHHPSGLGGYGLTQLTINKECITRATATVKKGTRDLGISATMDVVGYTPVVYYDTVLTSTKILTLMPPPSRIHQQLLAGSTVRVWGKYGDDLLVRNIGQNIMHPVSDPSWTMGFLGDDWSLAKMLSNIENSSNIIGSEKKASCKAVAQAMFENGFELSFIAGMLGNIMREAAAGEFEIYWGSSYQSYMLNLVNNHNYEARFGCAGPGYGRPFPYNQVFIYNMPQDNLTTVRALVELKQGTFGLGMVQWTDYARITTLLDLYKEVNGGGNTITEAQVRQAEGLMITRELLNHSIYKTIYPNWKSANSSNLNSQTAAYNAGSELCLKYEIPANSATEAVARGNNAKLIYVDLSR